MLKSRFIAGCLNGLVLTLALAVPSVALAAATKDKAASALQKEAMQTEYAETNFKKAEQKLKKAIAQCGASNCSSRVVGELHRDLATVYIAGLKQGAKGKAEMKQALRANPDLQLDEDFATPELRKVFKEQGGHEPKEAEEEEEKPAKAAKKASDDCESGSESCLEEEPEKADDSAPSKGAKSWLSLHFQQDLLLFSGQDQVCGSTVTGAPPAPNYSCFENGAAFDGNAAAGPGNQVSGGIGRATTRLLIGFDRVLGSNLSLGLRLGYAFGGRPAGESKFFPFHAEIRANYWFGAAPFESSGLRPYVSLSGGLAEVDGRVSVEYYDPAGNKSTVDAWRKTGKGFAGLGFGVMIPFAGDNGIVPELRAMQLFGASGTVFDISIGYARGF
ncbi:MAG TPA: hypothetical protein VJV79_31295 [Polyangiaceae bacterium]|nr:hypothetical protein [Polyangiaceae bacterium]